jgi:hypothetical protein
MLCRGENMGRTVCPRVARHSSSVKRTDTPNGGAEWIICRELCREGHPAAITADLGVRSGKTRDDIEDAAHQLGLQSAIGIP